MVCTFSWPEQHMQAASKLIKVTKVVCENWTTLQKLHDRWKMSKLHKNCVLQDHNFPSYFEVADVI